MSLAHYGDTAFVKDPVTGEIKPAAGATITVYQWGTTTPVSLLTSAGALLANPFASDPQTGRYDFWTSVGQRVTVQIALAGYTTQQITADVEPDPALGSTGAHTHPESDVINLITHLSARELISNKDLPGGYPSLTAGGTLTATETPVHTHPESDVTGLATDLGNKASNTHTHTRSFEFYVPFKAPVAGDDGGQFEINTATSVTAVRAIRIGGTAATVDVKKNGVSILTATVAPGVTYTAGTLTANPTAFAVNDILVVSVASLTGGPTEIDVKVIGTQATGAPQ